MVGKGFRDVLVPFSLFIVSMSLAIMVLGVIYRELSKYLGAGLPEEALILATHYLSLTHGHALSLGVVIPSAILLIALGVDYATGLSEATAKSLRKGLAIYAVGALSAIGLLLYKGIGLLYNYVQNPGAGLTAADEALFFGNHALREALYGTAHLIMLIGLAYMAVILIRSLEGAGAGVKTGP